MVIGVGINLMKMGVLGGDAGVALGGGASATVTTPSITSPTNGASDVSLTPTITSSAFASTPADTHASSDWQVASDAGFTVIVEQSLADAVNLESWTPPALDPEEVHYVRVRHNGTTLGASAWSAGVMFTTEAAPAYSAEATALFNVMDVEPDETRKQLIDDTIDALKAGGYWSTRDSIWVWAAHNEQASLLDWKRVNDMAKDGSPTFTPDKGFTATSGANKLINNSLTVSNASQNNVAFGTFRLAQAAGTSGNGTLQGRTTSIGTRHDSFVNSYRVNDSTPSSFTHTISLPDHIILLRNAASGAGSKSIWIDGALRASLNVASTTNVSDGIIIGHGNDDQHAISHVGAYMTPAQCDGFDAIMRTYLTAVGAI